MFLGFLKKIKESNFSKFFLSGVFSFLVDTIVLSVIIVLIFKGENVLLFGSISIAKLISSSIGLFTNFVLNRNWVFKAKSNGTIRRQSIKFITFSAVNVIFASIIYNIYLEIIIFLTTQFRLNIEMNFIFIFTNLITEGTKMIFSFFGYKYFVFRK